jgi:hypothetical protein
MLRGSSLTDGIGARIARYIRWLFTKGATADQKLIFVTSVKLKKTNKIAKHKGPVSNFFTQVLWGI